MRNAYKGTSGSFGRSVTALEQQGLIVRSTSPDDGRVALVEITARGRRAQRRLRDAQDEIFRASLADWSRRDLAQLAELLDRLAGDLRVLPGDEEQGEEGRSAAARR